jgi:TPR repeat protein
MTIFRLLPFFLVFLSHLFSRQADAALVCPLGQPDFTAADIPAATLALEAQELKTAAKLKGNDGEPARKRRLDLAYLAIESALKNEAINELGRAAAYWTLAMKDLGDTRWRMSQEVKAGDPRARWLSQESQEHAKTTPWNDAACAGIVGGDALNSPSALYRSALCASKTAPKKSLVMMQNAANGGHPAAMEAYGRLCAEQGEAGRECAVLMLCQAADAGRKSAAGLAAYVLTSQAPSPGLAVKAAALYEMAFATGDASSANNLGEVYERGWIGETNLIQAQNWYRQASNAGVVQAKLNLARILWQSASKRAEARALIEDAQRTMPTEAQQLLQQLERSRD